MSTYPLVVGDRACDLDHLLPQKTALECHLTARYGELFAAEFDVLLCLGGVAERPFRQPREAAN